MQRPSTAKATADLAARALALLPLRPPDLHVLLVLGDGPLHPYGISKAADSVARAIRPSSNVTSLEATAGSSSAAKRDASSGAAFCETPAPGARP